MVTLQIIILLLSGEVYTSVPAVSAAGEDAFGFVLILVVPSLGHALS